MKYTKNCPKCGKEMNYSRKDVLRLSLKENWLCRSCSQKGAKIKPEEKIKRKQKREKIYYEKNKNRLNEIHREYQKTRRKNSEYIKKQKKYMKEYNRRPEVIAKNRIRRNKYNAIYRKSPLIRTIRSFSASIRLSLKSNNLSKNGRHWEDIVGYTSQQLREHLEKQFQPGMSWKNQGKNGWVLDHIIPREFFKYQSTDDVEFRYCWSLNNLQPLWEIENKKKSDKLILWGKEIRARNIE